MYMKRISEINKFVKISQNSYLRFIWQVVNCELVVQVRGDEHVSLAQPLLNRDDLQLPFLGFGYWTFLGDKIWKLELCHWRWFSVQWGFECHQFL